MSPQSVSPTQDGRATQHSVVKDVNGNQVDFDKREVILSSSITTNRSPFAPSVPERNLNFPSDGVLRALVELSKDGKPFSIKSGEGARLDLENATDSKASHRTHTVLDAAELSGFGNFMIRAARYQATNKNSESASLYGEAAVAVLQQAIAELKPTLNNATTETILDGFRSLRIPKMPVQP